MCSGAVRRGAAQRPKSPGLMAIWETSGPNLLMSLTVRYKSRYAAAEKNGANRHGRRSSTPPRSSSRRRGYARRNVLDLIAKEAQTSKELHLLALQKTKEDLLFTVVDRAMSRMGGQGGLREILAQPDPPAQLAKA